MKMNCWDYKMCGFEIGGDHQDSQGVCPVAIAKKLDGINSGVNGGRFCWNVEGAFCQPNTQCTKAEKLKTCESCNFFNLVKQEEGRQFKRIEELNV